MMHTCSTWAEINWNVNYVIKSTIPTTCFEDYVKSINVGKLIIIYILYFVLIGKNLIRLF